MHGNVTSEAKPHHLRGLLDKAVYSTEWTDGELRGENLRPEEDYDNLRPGHRPWTGRREAEWERSAVSRQNRDWEAERKNEAELHGFGNQRIGDARGQQLDDYSADESLSQVVFFIVMGVVIFKFIFGKQDNHAMRRYYDMDY
ncbi:hypothetical protein ACHHYP_01400 [Achlya hypogyna]|uniref:Transmembrane protein n=1 Tax=Achlya hypogyna TaxID=1202772 RepID=A0A1V9Z8Q7_ACHHY|nr:hypothetical protein ACHHYP_01400 [Achlya hypogyna]